jgi:hypothetical protein
VPGKDFKLGNSFVSHWMVSGLGMVSAFTSGCAYSFSLVGKGGASFVLWQENIKKDAKSKKKIFRKMVFTQVMGFGSFGIKNGYPFFMLDFSSLPPF